MENCNETFNAISELFTVLKISITYIIKVVTANMNSKFTEVKQNKLAVINDIFCTNPTKKFRIFGIKHEYSVCLLHSSYEIQ